MIVYPSVRPVCDRCAVIRRNGRVRVIHRGSGPCDRRA
ncbi:50S ribosomal protein L36 [Microbacterium sp. SSW1-7]|nr:50S ribosomal protein L36 [Microbacterium aurugineum]MCK8477198.1 50S ribosomal protein L36 [Microbacterium aurugineum]